MLQSKRPILTQDSEQPIFECSLEENLYCECGQQLLKNISFRQVIGLDIKCFSCQKITRTPSWPHDEPFPSNGVVTIGNSGEFALQGCFTLPQSVSLTCDQEIIQSSTPSETVTFSTGIGFSIEIMQQFAEELNAFSQGELDKALTRTQKAFDHKNLLYMDYPPAWGILQIRRVIRDKALHHDSHADMAGFSYLHVLGHLLRRWQNHPLISLLSKASIVEFHHTITLLVTASYLTDAGNAVGFTNTPKENTASADLYININATQRLQIEIKAPKELQWPFSTPHPEKLEEFLNKLIRKAKKQINSELGGIIVIGASAFGRKQMHSIDQAIKNLIRKGKVSEVFAGIGRIYTDLQPDFGDTSIEPVTANVYSRTELHMNQRYAGEANIRIAPKPRR